MYYQKLMSIYHKFNFEEKPDISYIRLLADFMELNKSSKYLNPYKFSSHYNIPLKVTLALFALFSNEEGLLEPVYFFECSNITCVSERIFLEQSQLEKNEYGEIEQIICNECEKEYIHEEIAANIKMYFVISMKETNYTDFDYFEDPNSTSQCIGSLPYDLKHNSLPSSGNQDDTLDGGDESVQVVSVVESLVEVVPSYQSRISKAFRDLALHSHD